MEHEKFLEIILFECANWAHPNQHPLRPNVSFCSDPVSFLQWFERFYLFLLPRTVSEELKSIQTIPCFKANCITVWILSINSLQTHASLKFVLIFLVLTSETISLTITRLKWMEEGLVTDLLIYASHQVFHEIIWKTCYFTLHSDHFPSSPNFDSPRGVNAASAHKFIRSHQH